jgi:hypothetical protein
VTSLITIGVILVTVVPLCVFTELGGRQARKAPVRPAWYWCLEVSWLGGAVVAFIGVAVVDGYLMRSRDLSPWLLDTSLFLTGLLGGSVGPGLIYLHLRLRRTHDPDYGEYRSDWPA